MTLEEKLFELHKQLDTPYDPEDMDSIKAKLDRLNNLGGYAALCKADAREALESARLLALVQVQEEYSKLAPSLQSKMIDAICSYELRNFEYADRLNAGLSHCIEGIRSRLSLYKTEIEYSLNGANQQSRLRAS